MIHDVIVYPIMIHEVTHNPYWVSIFNNLTTCYSYSYSFSWDGKQVKEKNEMIWRIPGLCWEQIRNRWWGKSTRLQAQCCWWSPPEYCLDGLLVVHRRSKTCSSSLWLGTDLDWTPPLISSSIFSKMLDCNHKHIQSLQFNY